MPVEDLTIHFPADPESATLAVEAFLATLPDEAITREYMKRHNARRARAGGRPKTLTLCPKGCGQEFGVAELRTHIPRCTGKPPKKRKPAKKARRK